MVDRNAVIIIACILKDKINKMCTLKKWRIDYESKPYFTKVSHPNK